MAPPDYFEKTPLPPICHPGRLRLILRKPTDDLRERVNVGLVYEREGKVWMAASGHFSLHEMVDDDIVVSLELRSSLGWPPYDRDTLGMYPEDRKMLAALLIFGLGTSVVLSAFGSPWALTIAAVTVGGSFIIALMYWLVAKSNDAHARKHAAEEEE